MSEDARSAAAAPAGWTWAGSLAALAVALLAALVVLSTMGPIRDGDIGWHLALGRSIEHSGEIPHQEPYAWTAAGAPMVAHEWLSQRLYWEITKRSGLRGLRWANALLAAVLVPLLYVGFVRYGHSRALALLGCLLFVLIARGRFQIRPHMLNLLLCTVLYVALFLRGRTLGRTAKGFVVATVAVWANLHSGAVIFPVLLGIHAAVRWIEERQPRKIALATPGPGLVLAALCAGALLLTPHHVRLFPYLIESARINANFSWEWLSLLRYVGHPSSEPIGTALPFAVVAGSLWTVVRARRLGESVATPLLGLFCALLPLQSVRFVWLCFVPIAEILRATVAAIPARARPRVELAAGLACAVAFVPIAGSPASVATRLDYLPRAVTFFPRAFPIGSASLLSEITVPGHLFARAEWGGYLTLTLNERYAIFSDGRWVTIGEQIVHDGHKIATRRPDARLLLDRYEIDLALLERGWMRGPEDPAHEDWLRVFAGVNSEMWVRRGKRGAAQRDVFARYYAERGIPFDATEGFDASRATKANPSWASAHGVRRLYYDHFREDGRYDGYGRLTEDWPDP
jgi:hypothetical protein